MPATARLLAALIAIIVVGLGIVPSASAIEPPASCAERKGVPDGVTPIPLLRKRVETLGETDPFAALDILCANLPRVLTETGANSLESARWTQALATPLIAYLNRFAEAEVLLVHAEPILARKLGRISPEIAEIHVAYGWMSMRRGRMTESADAWSKALAIREKYSGARKIELQKALAGLAQARLSQRRFAEARQLTARGFAIIGENGEYVSDAAAAFKNLMANIAIREEKYAEARQHAEQQIDIELQLHAQGGPDQPVTAYALLGQILQRLNEYDAAERALREALRLAESSNGPLQRNALTALVQLSSLLNERGNPREALHFANQSLQLGERELGPEAPTLVAVLSNLAESQRLLGDFAPALHSWERAAKISVAHAADVQPQIRVRAYRNYGSLLLELGDHGAAERELLSALEVSGADATLSTDRAATLVVLSGLTRRTDRAAAQLQLQQALAIYRAKLPDEHPLLLRVTNELCSLELTANATTSGSCVDAADRLARSRFADPALRQAVLENQSELARAQHDPERMLSFALQSLAAATTLATPDPLWRANYQLARTLHQRREQALAIFFGKQSIDELQKLRRSLVADTARLDPLFVHDKVAVYRNLADWLMEASRFDEALEVLDLMKSEEQRDFLVRGAADETGGHAQGRVSRNADEIALQERFTRALAADTTTGAQIDALSRLRQTDRITPAERTRLEQLLAAQQQLELDRTRSMASLLTARTDQTGRDDVLTRSIRAARLTRELQRFGNDSALGIFLLTDTQLRVVVATRTGQTEILTAVDAGKLRRDIGLLLDDIAERRDVMAPARALYDTLLRPLADAARSAGARRLVLWPDGPLRYLPFAALHDGEQFLVERFAIQLYAEATAADGAAQGRRPGMTVRGFGVTRAVAGFAALPSVADELCGIVRGPIAGLVSASADCVASQDQGAAGRGLNGRGALLGAGFADRSFTQQQLESTLNGPHDFTALHIGTHFSLRPGNAVRSYLVLGDGAQFTLDRLTQIDLSGIELMTLSACQTALGGAVSDDGREVESLSALAQRRGVARVVASLWRVEDRSTSLLMKEFYRQMSQRPGGSAQALRAAQLNVRNQTVNGKRPYAHPYFWSGFTLATTKP